MMPTKKKACPIISTNLAYVELTGIHNIYSFVAFLV